MNKQTRTKLPEGTTQVRNASTGEVTHKLNESTGKFERVDQNSCDGCNAGMIIKEGIHYNKFGGVHISCQKSKYKGESK